MRTITQCWSITTPESAEHGDYAATGSDGVVWSDTDADPDEALDVTVARFLRDAGVTQASSSHFHGGMWYATDPKPNYNTGEDREDTFHLKGFSLGEERAVAARLVMSRTVRVHL